MTYKMIVTDIDDTLLNSQRQLTEKTKQALHEASAKGIKIVLASGRPESGMKKLAQQLNLAENNGYLLAYNGGLVVDCSNNKVIYSQYLSPERLAKLHDIALANGADILSYKDDKIITNRANEYADIESELIDAPVEVADFKATMTVPAVKVLMLAEPTKAAILEKELAQQFKQQYTILRSKPFFIEVTDLNITKGQTLATLAQQWGIERHEIIAFGDGNNDISMIEFAGLGVAMSNATEELKAVSDVVTLSNDEDGLAHALNKFVFNKL